MRELKVRLVGSGSQGKTVLAALLQALAARPVAHDAQVWLVDACSVTDAHADASALLSALVALNDHTTYPGWASHVTSLSHHTLDRLHTQAADGPPQTLWIPDGHGSDRRSAYLHARENEQHLDILTEFIACARPFTGRAFADDVRFTLSTLRAEFSRSSRLSQAAAPWVRFLDFTWPAPVVGRSLADLLQHQAPDVADAWRTWSMHHSTALNGHMAGVWRHAAPRHDVTGGAVFVLLSATACRTLTVPPPPAAQRRLDQPDVVPRGTQSTEHEDGARPTADAGWATAGADGEPSDGRKQSPSAAEGERQSAEPDTPFHLGQRIDDLLTTIAVRGGTGQGSRDARERWPADPPDTLEAIAPVLDERTVQAIKAYEPGEDTLPPIERLLLSAAR